MSDIYTLEHIQFPRSITPDAVPLPTILAEGALGLNLKDKVIYSLDEEGNVVTLAKNYDAVLTAHFQADNPHGITKETLNLGNVPNVDTRPLYYINPNSFTLNTQRLITQIDYWETDNVTYTITNSVYQVGDIIEVSRINDSAGEIELTITGGQWNIQGTIETESQVLNGSIPFTTTARKVNSTDWLVKVGRI